MSLAPTPAMALNRRPIWMDDWQAALPGGAGVPRALDGTPSCDCVIVGAGLTGLTLAYRLASAGQQVVLLDAQHVGYGASLRNAGFCTSSAPFSAGAAVARHGSVAATALLHWFFGAPTQVRALLEELGSDGGWVDGERLVLAQTPLQAARLRSEARQIKQMVGRDIGFLDAESTRARLGQGNFAGALHDRNSASLNPACLLHALLQACLAAGVRILEGVQVEQVRRTGARYAVMHASGAVDTGKVIFATNGYTGKLGFGNHQLIIPVGSFIIASKPIINDPLRVAAGSAVFSTASRFPNYFRFTPDGTLLFGGRRSLSHETSVDLVAHELLQDARRLLPDLDFQIDRCWGGRLGFTQDRQPVMGRLDDGVYFVGGCCGHGVPTSIASANALAGLLLGTAPAMPAFYRDKLALSLVPQIATLLLPAIGTYYRIRDRLEAMDRRSAS